MVIDIKKDIMADIIKELDGDIRHEFSEPFRIYFTSGIYAATESCTAVGVWHDGTLAVYSVSNTSEDVTEGNTILGYDVESLIRILTNLKAHNALLRRTKK